MLYKYIMKAFLIYLSDEQKEELDALARKQDRSRSGLIRIAVNLYLEEGRKRAWKEKKDSE